MKKFYLMLLGLIVAVAANAAPASTLYLVGNPAGDWKPTKGIAMDMTSDGVFEIDQTFTKTQWFGFTQKLGSSDSDWATFNNNRYNPPQNNYIPTINTPVTITLGGAGNSFQLGAGSWHFKVDTNNNTFTCTGQVVEDPKANVFYLRGAVSSWGTQEAYKFTQDGDTYTLKVASLAGAFKIANHDYSKQFSTSTPIELNKEYDVSNIGETNCKLAKEPLSNITLTFVKTSDSTGKLTITGENEAPEYPEKLYFSANLNGFDWVFNNEMTANENVFTYEFEVTGSAGYATFSTDVMDNWQTDGIRYGSGDQDVNVTIDETYPMVVGSDKTWKLNKGKYIATVTYTDGTPSVVFTQNGIIPITVPEKLYISYDLTGEAEGKGWSFNHKLTNESDGIFTSEPFTVTAETGYFTLTSTELTDWNLAEGGIRYGAGDSEVAVEEDKTYDVNPVNDNCWTVAPGTYYITVNFSVDDNTITLTLTRTEMPAKYPELYFRCSDNEWSATDAYKLTCTEGVYTISLPSLYGAFRIGDAAWNDENTATTANMAMAVGEPYDTQNRYGGDSDNMAMADGLTNVTVTYDYNNAKIKVEGTVDESATVEFSIFGNFNLFVAEEPALLAENPWNSIAMAQDGEKWSATVVPAAENGEFLITQSRKAVNLAFYKADADATLSTAAEPLTLGADKENNIKYALDPTHKYNLSFVPETGVLSATDEGLTTGIEAIVAEGNEAPEYFNLQGVRVAQPEAGNLYIVRRGASVAKVLVK